MSNQKLVTAVEQFLATQKPFSRLIVAFSGGLDSTVLLHVLSGIESLDNQQILAVYVDHGLQDAAKNWSCFCQETAQKFQLSFQALKLDLHNISSNIEAVARQARYKALSSLLCSEDCLLTAHHQDDQAETFLLNLMRGSGVDGLSAMKSSQSFAGARLLRPLLDCSRDSLLKYAREHELQWIDDPSNMDLRFDRNFIRHEVLPVLQNRWPGAVASIAMSSAHCQQTRQFLEEKYQPAIDVLSGSIKHRLNLIGLADYSDYEKMQILRQWLRLNQVDIPQHNQLVDIIESLTSGNRQSACVGEWRYYRVFLHCQYVYVIVQEAFKPESVVCPLTGLEDKLMLELPGRAGHLAMTLNRDFNFETHSQLTIRYRSDGDLVRLNKRNGTRKLKKLFQEWQIPLWGRELLPLIYFEDECIAIADFAWCETPLIRAFSEISWKPDAKLEWREKPVSLKKS